MQLDNRVSESHLDNLYRDCLQYNRDTNTAKGLVMGEAPFTPHIGCQYRATHGKHIAVTHDPRCPGNILSIPAFE